MADNIVDKIKNLYSKIGQTIIGSSVDDLVNAEKSIRRLKQYTDLNDSNKVTDLIKAITGTDSTENAYTKIIGSELTNSVGGIESDRLARYREYDLIEAKIPYIKRALNILTQNILYPEELTDIFNIAIGDEDNKDNKNNIVVNNVKDILKKYEINKNTKKIVYNVLKYGDYFVETVSVSDVLKRNKISENFVTYKNKLYENIGDVKINENNDITLLFEDSTLSKNQSSDNKSKVFLNFISPSSVVRLGDKFCFGYIVFPQMLSQSMQQGSFNVQNIQQGSSNIQSITQKILTRLRSKHIDYSDENNDLTTTIAKILTMMPPENQQLIARFVPPNQMVHFNIDKSRFEPYGTSKLYGTEFLARIIVAIEGSIMIQRINRSIERRMFKVEIGPSRDAETYINNFKEKMERKKFTVDNVGSIDSVASQLATFEDIYLPMRNGRTYIEYDAIPPQGELSSRVDDLKALRDTLVASTDVPPAYLGIEENIESKNTLAQQNIVFATTIMNYQRELAEYFTELVRTINSFTNIHKDINNVEISFNRPISLIAEKNADFYQAISNMITSLEPANVPADYIAKKYLTSFDWKAIEDMRTSKKTEETIGVNQQEGGNK